MAMVMAAMVVLALGVVRCPAIVVVVAGIMAAMVTGTVGLVSWPTMVTYKKQCLVQDSQT